MLCDNGGDATYTFEDIGNLSRKIRMDFGAEMIEVDASMFYGEKANTGKKLTDYIGDSFDFSNAEKRKGKCLLLYKIIYRDDKGETDGEYSLLVVMKPNLISDTPIDIMHYASTAPDFPQQSTIDQFFDEAQWESYRALGEKIAHAVITEEAVKFDGWYEKIKKIT